MNTILRCLLLCWCAWAPAQETLCGAAGQRVCLQSSIQVGLNGVSLLEPGTAVVLRLPGMAVDASGTVSGSPEPLYRLDDHGTVIDGQGGTWETMVLAEDARGITVLAYVLTTGTLVAPSALTVSEFRVCTLISDGPDEVTLGLTLIVVGGKRAYAQALPAKRMPGFEPCAAYACNVPVPGSTIRAYTTNVHHEPVYVGGDGLDRVLQPGEQMMLETASPHQLAPGMPLPMVLYSDTGDIDVVGLPAGNHTSFVVPHSARDTDSWRNDLVFAADEALTVDFRRGDHVVRESFGAGAHFLSVDDGTEPDRLWAFLLAGRPISGFFSFARKDGAPGAAWVAPVRTDISGEVTPTTLYLPHVAADRTSFWTGFSLANTGSDALHVTLEGMTETGGTTASEQLTLAPGENAIGVIGTTHLVGADPSWVRITADGGLTGIQLVGGQGENTALAGFQLPSAGAERLVFPLLQTEGGFWSGVALLNPGNVTATATVRWKDAAGATLSNTPVQAAARTKQTLVAPEGAVQAEVVGAPLIAFCLIGEYTSSRLGGYLGMVPETD